MYYLPSSVTSGLFAPIAGFFAFITVFYPLQPLNENVPGWIFSIIVSGVNQCWICENPDFPTLIEEGCSKLLVYKGISREQQSMIKKEPCKLAKNKFFFLPSLLENNNGSWWFDYPQGPIPVSLSACTYCIHPVVSLLLSCHLPVPYTNAIPVRVPNEAQWECSLAFSLQACSHPGIPKEFGWLGSLFLVPWVLAAPALMHHSHKHANVCNSPSLIHKKRMNMCANQ